GAGRFVAVGSQGRISTSPDGVNWTLQTTPGEALGIERIAVGGGVTLGIGGDYVLMRDIKARWRPSATFPGAYQPFYVMYVNGQFIVFTRLRASPPRVFAVTSPNGITWTATEVKSTGGAVRMIYAKGEYLGVGGGVFHSTDGMIWMVQPVGYPNGFSAVAFGNDRYVAIGVENRAFISSNGTDWKSVSTGTHWLADIVFAEGKFVAIGNDYFSSGGGSTLTGRGEILTSIDGENWEIQTTPFGLTTKTDLGSITYGGGWFVVVGGQGLILTSRDGMHWDSIDSPTRQLLNTVAYADGVFTAAGGGGTMLVSGNVFVSTLSAPKLQKEGFSFTMAGGSGQVYQVQFTSGLTPPNWTELASVTNETGNVRFLDPAAGQTESRFYRVQGLP
ncbi:MAG: hypothetical protein JWM99_2741, partial [Verrucomicrobiales bacterium]|nr:hypothetical protein [Verrucomicrobiales bacterium]